MNRLEWGLGIVLVILLIVVAVFSVLLWFNPNSAAQVVGTPSSATVVAARGNQIAPTPIFAGQTARVAFVAAQSTATTWQSDATLLNASATWPQGANATDLLTGETTWSFTFYSPQAGQTALISVVENEAELLSTSDYQPTSAVLNAAGWQLDSKDVIEQFLNQGGEQFISSNGVTTLTTMLTTNNEANRIEWFISLFGDQTGASMSMRIDATSGEILEGAPGDGQE